MRRTTLMLDEATRKAARVLATRYGCSTSEAIRRAVLQQHDRMLGVPPAARRQRRKVLARLEELFEGHDAAAEVAELKRTDRTF